MTMTMNKVLITVVGLVAVLLLSWGVSAHVDTAVVQGFLLPMQQVERVLA